jgi:SAM-dependent methyltransferase
MAMFLRKSADRRDPLPVTMSGVRMGERVLQIGVDDPGLTAAIAAKVGLSGHAVIAVPDLDEADRARAAAAEIGILADVQVIALPRLPCADGDFDAVVIHSRLGLLPSLSQAERQLTVQECRRVLRPGGRVVVIELGERSGLASMFARAPKPDPVYEATGGAAGALEAAGFRPVRVLADREGFRFVEGLNT